MNRFLQRLTRDEQGASAIEMAIALPVLILFIYGIFVIGMLFQASAGMQHGLGEAARHATLYPTPTDAQIRQRLTDKKFGTEHGTLGTLSIVDGGTTGAMYKDLSLTYSQPTNFLFVAGPNVSITRTKRVYTQS